MLKKSYSGRHTEGSTEIPLHLHKKEVARNGHTWWKPAVWKGRAQYLNEALKEPGVGCRKDKSHFLILQCKSGWLFER